jgi:hypothetical protein
VVNTIESSTYLSASTPKTALQRLEELVNDIIIIDQQTASITHNITVEITCYLTASRAHKNNNPLIWWHTYEQEYLILAVLARNYFAVPASSVLCEQFFSIAGNIITKNHNSLAPETAQALLCLRSCSEYM